MAESLTASTTATVQVFNRILLRDQEKLERLVALEKMKDPEYPERVLVVHNAKEIDTIEKLEKMIERDISIFTGFEEKIDKRTGAKYFDSDGKRHFIFVKENTEAGIFLNKNSRNFLDDQIRA